MSATQLNLEHPDDEEFIGGMIFIFGMLGRTILPVHAAAILNKFFPSEEQANTTGLGPERLPQSYEEAGTYLAKWAPEALAYDEQMKKRAAKMKAQKLTAAQKTKPVCTCRRK